MKNYTDIEQSKKLEEILPLESADIHYFNYGNIAKPYIGFDANETRPEINNGVYEYIPAWTLAALLKVIPKKIKDFNVLRIDINEEDFSIWYDDVGCGVNTELPDITMECPVDACYELILKLHELNLL